jgi:hypothetical protein
MHTRFVISPVSGKVYCTGCLRSAATADELNAITCYAEYMED